MQSEKKALYWRSKPTMKGIHRFVEKNDTKILLFFSITLCLLSCLYYLIHHTPSFLLNDDVSINEILVGNRGEQNRPYIPFSNICYGYWLCFLYDVTQSVNWYTVYPIILCIFAITFFSALLVKISKNCLVLVTPILFILMFGNYLLFHLTFTYYASFFSAIGLILLYLASFRLEGKEKIIVSVIGMMLAITGYWIRRMSFIAVAAIIGVCVVYQLYKKRKEIAGKFNYRKDAKKIIRHWFRYTWSFLLLLCVASASYMINDHAYHSSEEWRYWREYNSLRASLIDFGMPEYEEYQAQYNAIGIDELDYKLFKSFVFADLNTFSLETLQKMNDLKEQVKNESFSFVSSVMTLKQNILGVYRRDKFFSLLLFIGAMVTLSKRKHLWLFCPFFVGIAECYYLTFKGRFNFRGVIGILMTVWLLVIISMNENESVFRKTGIQKSSRVFIAIVAGVMVALLPPLNNLVAPSDQSAKNTSQVMNQYELRDALLRDRGSLYVTEPANAIKMSTYEALPVRKRITNNFYPLGGWGIPSPLYQYLLKDYGIDEEGIIRGMYDNRANIYYYCHDTSSKSERLLTYIQRNYDENVKIEKVDQCQRVNIFRYYLDQQPASDVLANTSFSSYDFIVGIGKNSYILDGCCKSDDIDPYKQNVWIRLTSKNKKKTTVSYIRCSKMLLRNNYLLEQQDHGNASGFSCEIPAKKIKKAVRVELVLTDGGTKTALKDITDRFYTQ